MTKNLSMKNKFGKWWTYGKLATNQYGNEQISFKLENLKKLVDDAETMGKAWVNLSLFEDDREKPEAKPASGAVASQVNTNYDELDDIPF
jgi:hypothetical protein